MYILGSDSSTWRGAEHKFGLNNHALMSSSGKYPTNFQESAPQIICKVVDGGRTTWVIQRTELQCSSIKCDSFLQICYGALPIVSVT